MLYYVYERETGKFAGSGIFPIDTETHASTTVEIPTESEQQPAWKYNEGTGQWEKVIAV